MAESSDVASQPGLTNHGRYTGALDFPVEQFLIKFLGASKVAAPDFKVNYRIWHFYILE